MDTCWGQAGQRSLLVSFLSTRVVLGLIVFRHWLWVGSHAAKLSFLWPWDFPELGLKAGNQAT